MKRIQKTKNHVKSELEITIRAIDFKYVEIVSVVKKVESALKYIGLEQQELQQILAKQKRLFEIWFFLSSGKRFIEPKNPYFSCFG